MYRVYFFEIKLIFVDSNTYKNYYGDQRDFPGLQYLAFQCVCLLITDFCEARIFVCPQNNI